ncbi:hypothetical protein D9613_011439 [Agrocybe pediades]|uniref:Uncharacterized protein n=1 Tax=Agrocybe pediades TaxID=84607 RepID=A0A8H4VN38_9AGAR|nr:hypothetical protein D9613_011439 [Agrocybe pediades]
MIFVSCLITYTMTQRQPTLPQELLDLIIDDIASDPDHGSTCLRACSLASESLLRRSRMHLFRKVQFVVDSSASARAKAFLRLLGDNENSYLLNHIQSFRLIVDASSANIFRPAHPSWIPSKINHARQRIFSSSTNLMKLLQFLQGLTFKKFTIEARNELPSWTDLKDEIKDNLYAVRTIPTLSALEIIGLQDLDITFIAGTPGRSKLSHLTLERTSIRNESLAWIPLENMTQIQCLQVTTVPRYQYSLGLGEGQTSIAASGFLPYDVPTAISFRECFPNATVLVLSIPREDYFQGAFWRTVSSLHKTLETLVIKDFYWNFRPQFISFDLPIFPQLKTLELNACGDNIISCIEFSREIWTFMSSTSSSMTSVDTLILDLTIEGRFWNRTDRITEYFAHLRASSILHRLARHFPLINTVHFNLRLIDNHIPGQRPLPNLDSWPPISVAFGDFMPSTGQGRYYFYVELLSDEGTTVLYQSQ